VFLFWVILNVIGVLPQALEIIGLFFWVLDPFTLGGRNFLISNPFSNPCFFFLRLLVCQLCQEEEFHFWSDTIDNEALSLDPACLEHLSVRCHRPIYLKSQHFCFDKFSPLDRTKKNPLKKIKKIKILQDIITNLKFQHKPKNIFISFFQKSSYLEKKRPIIIT
jgi:hypothetical protein